MRLVGGLTYLDPGVRVGGPIFVLGLILPWLMSYPSIIRVCLLFALDMLYADTSILGVALLSSMS